MDQHRKGYWKEREQTPERKEYQRKYKAKYMREYRKKHPRIMKKIEQRYSKKRCENIRKKREEILNLLGGKCSECGYKKCPSALEIHHPNPKLKENTWRRNVSLKNMIKEAKKCVLLCANCHRGIHFNKTK